MCFISPLLRTIVPTKGITMRNIVSLRGYCPSIWVKVRQPSGNMHIWVTCPPLGYAISCGESSASQGYITSCRESSASRGYSTYFLFAITFVQLQSIPEGCHIPCDTIIPKACKKEACWNTLTSIVSTTFLYDPSLNRCSLPRPNISYTPICH